MVKVSEIKVVGFGRREPVSRHEFYNSNQMDVFISQPYGPHHKTDY